VAQGVDPEFKPQYHKKRKKERKNLLGFSKLEVLSSNLILPK
jgi:hypothetical protein